MKEMVNAEFIKPKHAEKLFTDEDSEESKQMDQSCALLKQIPNQSGSDPPVKGREFGLIRMI
jgi:hypothetical protein